jgi:uncharacterized protein (DUF488 family)
MAYPYFTVGHSTRTIPEFVALLKTAAVQLVVDIRTVPRSRTNPQFNGYTLGAQLAPFQIGYEQSAELGGLRGRVSTIPTEVNGFWTNQSFHNYADYAMSDEFRDGLERLVSLGRERRLAMMCSEAVWWRCHRRIVADHLLARGEAVFHLMGDSRIESAHLTAGASPLEGGTVAYPSRDGSVDLACPSP